jgi:hypothetical protein
MEAGIGKYCGKVGRWILCTWNGENLWIIELPPEFSVAFAVSGGIFDRKAGYFAARSGPMVF